MTSVVDTLAKYETFLGLRFLVQMVHYIYNLI